MSDEFIREVDEDLRREQLNEFFRRYRGLIIGLIVGVIAVVAGREAWIAQREAKLARNSEDFAQVQEAASLAGTPSERAQIFAAARPDLTGGFADLAAFDQAAAELAADNAEAALALYDELASTAGQGLGDYARLLAVLAAMQAGSTNDQLRDRLEPLSLPDGAYRLLVLELLAAIDIEEGDYARANERLNEILADQNASQPQRQRVDQLVAYSETLERLAQSGDAGDDEAAQ